jgi:hypothetical protein
MADLGQRSGIIDLSADRQSAEAMAESHRGVLPRIAGEFLLVVAGVLVAFQFDNWRATEIASRQAQEQLADVHADLLENQRRLAEVLGLQQMIVDRGRALLSIMDQQVDIAGDSISSLMMGAIAFAEVEPVTSAYDALINSGDMRRIPNPDLLRRLAAFHGELSAGFEDHQNSVNLQHSIEVQLSPYVADVAPWRAYVGLPEVDPTRAAAVLMSDKSFKGLLFLKLTMEQNRLDRHQNLAAAVDSMLALVEQELAR